jgi:hypothetical protein
MIKKWFFILVLIPVLAGSTFAQTDIETMPKNTITVDFRPTVVAAAKTKQFTFFLKGGKLGCQIKTDRDGRFIIEPSLGYNGGTGPVNTIGQKITKEIAGNVKDFDEALAKLERFLFSGGPRFSLVFGWRF